MINLSVRMPSLSESCLRMSRIRVRMQDMLDQLMALDFYLFGVHRRTLSPEEQNSD